MPRNTNVILQRGIWTLVSQGAISKIRLQNQSSSDGIWIQATAGEGTPPTNIEGSIRIPAMEVVGTNWTIAELWPGVSGANAIWAMTQSTSVTLSVSHA